MSESNLLLIVKWVGVDIEINDYWEKSDHSEFFFDGVP